MYRFYSKVTNDQIVKHLTTNTPTGLLSPKQSYRINAEMERRRKHDAVWQFLQRGWSDRATGERGGSSPEENPHSSHENVPKTTCPSYHGSGEIQHSSQNAKHTLQNERGNHCRDLKVGPNPPENCHLTVKKLTKT